MGEGTIPSVTQWRSTAIVHSASRAKGSRMNQGTRHAVRSPPGTRARPLSCGTAGVATALLVLAQLGGRFPRGLAQELVGVRLGHVRRHVAGDDAVVGEVLADALDRLQGQ